MDTPAASIMFRLTQSGAAKLKTKSLCWKNRESSRNDEFVYEYVFEDCRENYE